MKKKVFLSVLCTIILGLSFCCVSAEGFGTSPELQLPSLEDIKENSLEISPLADMNGWQYNAIYGIDFAHRYGWNGGGYGPRKDYNAGMPTSMPGNPYPFDQKLTPAAEAIFTIALSSRNGTLLKDYAVAYTAAYCVGWGVPFGSYDQNNFIGSTAMKEYDFHELYRTRDGLKLTDGGMRQVRYALTYGYNYPIIPARDIHNALGSSYNSVLDGCHYFGSEVIKDAQPHAMATQYLCWVASNEYLTDDVNSKKVEDAFFEYSWNGNKNVQRDGIPGIYYGYKDNVVKAMKMPSYSYSTEQEAKNNAIELRWNESNQRFESRVNDANAMSLVPKVQLSYQNQVASLNFEQQPDGSVIMWSKSVIGSMEDKKTFKVVKNIEGAKDAIVIAKSADKVHQPVVVSKPGTITETADVAVYTQALKIKVNKELVSVNGNYGDAVATGCEYTIYEDEACTVPVDTLVVGQNGNTNKSKYLPYKTYYALETKNNDSTKINSTKYTIDPTQAVIDSDGDLVYTIKATNEIVLTELRIVKFWEIEDSSEQCPAEGAVLRLTLKNNNEETYTQTVDKNGYACFTNIPYGEYTLSEDTSNSDIHLEIDEKDFQLYTPKEINWYTAIIEDKYFKTYLKIVKVDSETNKEIKLAGATFKLYNVDEGKFEKFMTSTDGKWVEELTTNEEGLLVTPQEVGGGNYILYETKAPEGYYLDPKYTIPTNPEDIGDITKGGIEVKLTKLIEVDKTEDNKFIHTIKVVEEPLKVKLEIFKKGEMLTEVLTSATEYGDKYTPVYKLQYLPGVTFDIIAAKDIVSPDGTQAYVAKGTVVDTVTTLEDGIATTKELLPGEYEIKEVATQNGYVIDKNIPNVVLDNNDTLKRVEVTSKELTNIRQKLGLTFKKVFEELNYANGETVEQKATFGVYTKEAIKNYNGNIVIPSNKLVALAEVDENGDVTSPVDLPEGKYYVEELATSYPYTISDKRTEFTLEYNNNNEQEFVVVEGEEFTNTYDSASITLVKLSSTTVDNVILNGDEIDKSELDDKIKEVLDAIKGMTEEEIKQYFADNDVKVVAGAKYRVYTDEKCKNELRIKNKETGKFEVAEFITNETGLIKLEEVPIGEYYIKEIEAPVGSELSKEIVKVTVDNTNKNTMIYQALKEDDIVEAFITKTDIFTGDVIPNCTFEIKDMEGNVLLHSITNEDGKAFIPVKIFENGKTYTYTEIEAPDIYDLNKEPHEFVAKYDEETAEWLSEPIAVENIRKTREVIVRKVDAETGDPLEGCVFTIALIDPATGEQIINAKTGEPVYLVENATTNENGEYVIEKAPMGTYRFTEIKAPEGYELDEDLTGVEFTIDINSPETIIFEVTNTGDIAVITLSVIAIASIFGIAYIVLKIKKQNYNNYK